MINFGARNEVKIAIKTGLPIFYPKSTNDLKDDESNENAKDNVNWNKVIDILGSKDVKIYIFKSRAI